METQTSPAIINIDGALEIFRNAPEALKLNQDSTIKALYAGQSLFDTIKAEGMSDDLDILCNDFLVKLKKTYDRMNERRKPMTQIMDEFKKWFTSEEAKLDPKSRDNIYFQIQTLRNQWVAQKAAETSLKQEAIRQAQQREEALAILKCDIEAAIKTFFDGLIATSKSKIATNFDKVTLDNYENAWKYFNTPLIGPTKDFAFEQIDEKRFNFTHISLTDYRNIKGEIFSEEVFQHQNSILLLQINEYRQSYFDKLPSRKTELEAIAEAERNNALEAERLKAEAKKRQEEEAEARRIEEEKKAKEAAAMAEANKSAAVTNTLFDAAALSAEIVENITKAKESYAIEVMKTAGWLQIIQLYFEKEGNFRTPIELEKKTLLQMKAFCEKYALKTEEKLSSPFLKYIETYKAIAVKK